jgi:DNA repair protein RecO (recombination protein O)
VESFSTYPNETSFGSILSDSMPAEKSDAIVLKVVEFSETSCVVTMFTRDFGKITAIAKGARRPKSPFESALDVLSVCRIVFHHKSADVLDLLTEAKLIRRFRAAERDLQQLYAGYYVAELLLSLTDFGHHVESLFQAAEQALIDLDHGVHHADCLLRFELLMLRYSGQLPLFSKCVDCGSPLTNDAYAMFSVYAGGMVCQNCRDGKRQVIRIQSDNLRQLDRMSEPAWVRTEIDDRDGSRQGEVRGLMNLFIAHLLGRRPKMSEYLDVLGRK